MKTLDEIGLNFQTDKSSIGHDYLRHYDKVFSDFRDADFTLIEIGGLNGASLKSWQEYFTHARIVCIDIDERVKEFETDRIVVEIGNSGSTEFLRSIAARYPNPAIVIDDGSHRWDHQRIAFDALFPFVQSRGLYVVEDIHTSYESGFSGADNLPFTETLKLLSDFLHLRGERRTEFLKRYRPGLVEAAKSIDSIQFVPRSCIIRKR